MRVLAFTSINRHRLDVLLGSFGEGDGVPLPATVAGKETIIVNPKRWWWWPAGKGGGSSSSSGGSARKIRMGVRVKDLTASVSELGELQQLFQEESYLLNVLDGSSNSTTKNKKEEQKQSRKRKSGGRKSWPQVMVALREDATNLTLLKASFHAYLLQQRRGGGGGGGGGEGEGGGEEGVLSLIRATYEEACSSFPLLEDGLRKQGWNLERVLLSPEGWVYHEQEK